MPQTFNEMFQLVTCWLFLLTGRCEAVAVSPPIPLAQCEALQIKTRLRKTKFIHAYCL